MKYRFLRLTGRFLVTAAVVGVACVAAWKLWDDNMNAPWTRDAHVRADVVGVTPDVSGLVAEVLVGELARAAGLGAPLPVAVVPDVDRIVRPRRNRCVEVEPPGGKGPRGEGAYGWNRP